MNALSLSVVIPTLGREEETIRTLEDLMKQTHLPDEILVVDQNQPSLPRLDAACAQHPAVKHIRSDRPGVVYNLNLGLMNAKSELILIIDDDVLVDSHLIERHIANYVNAEIGAIAGRIEQPQGDQDPSSIVEFATYHPYSGKVVAHFNAKQKKDVDLVAGGNMSFRKSVLFEIGGFDLGFDGNAYWFEPDTALRVREAGYRIVFDPNASLRHLMAPRGGCRISSKAEHTYYYIKNGLRLFRKHSPRWMLPAFVLKKLLYVILKAAYNRDSEILSKGIKAIIHGLHQPIEHQTNLKPCH